ncbi:MAG TPA: DUF6629 family protein [Bacteroidia bacterium]|nr:DUF6629 family protein [Bacteroidia bacterium]
MCFSASASFGAGILLTGIGAGSIKQVRQPAELFFASIPLIFGVQQLSEGFVWLSLSRPGYVPLQHVATFLFLFFAQVVWPVWVPLSIMLLKKKERRKLSQKLLTATGALVSAYLAYCLFRFHVEAKIIGYHISYEQDYPEALATYGGLLYIIATIAPPFFSDIRRMWMLGAAILISYIITELFYTDYIVSVWCFFASVISIAVWVIMYKLKKTNAASETHMPLS